MEPVRSPRADAARNRGLLLDAARRLFAEQGLDVTVGQIAKEAGVGNGTAFRHFPTKDDLLHAVLEQRMQEMLDFMRAQLEVDDAWAAFEGLCVRGVEMLLEDNGLLEAVKRNCVQGPGIDQCKVEMGGVVQQILDRGKVAGVVRADLTFEDFAVMINAAANAARVPETDGGGTAAANRVLALMLAGARASSGDVNPPLPGRG